MDGGPDPGSGFRRGGAGGTPRRAPSRLRQVAMVLVFDLGGPLLAYAGFKSAGFGDVLALVLSGVLPAIGIAVGAVLDRRLDVIGAMVLAGIAVGSLLGLTSHDPRLFLVEGSVPSAVFALACLASLRWSRPLMFRLALEVLGPDTRRGRQAVRAWQYPSFRRAFGRITAVWGVVYLAEAGVRVAIIEMTSTGIALVTSKVLPYGCAVVLVAWTYAYGERHRRAAEQAAAEQAAHQATAGTAPEASLPAPG